MVAVSLMLIFLFDVVLCYFEIPNMLKNKMIKEFWVFLILLLVGTLSAILIAIDKELVPNPSEWVVVIYEPMGSFFKKLL